MSAPMSDSNETATILGENIEDNVSVMEGILCSDDEELVCEDKEVEFEMPEWALKALLELSLESDPNKNKIPRTEVYCF